MKTYDCFTCNLAKGCQDCEYALNELGYAFNKKLKIRRVIESWNFHHPDDKMPQKGFVIHHRSGKLHDVDTEKMTWVQHSQYHFHGDGRGFTGKKHSQKTIALMRKKATGRKGTPHTDEFIEKMRGIKNPIFKMKAHPTRGKHNNRIQLYWKNWWKNITPEEYKNFCDKVSLGRMHKG